MKIEYTVSKVFYVIKVMDIPFIVMMRDWPDYFGSEGQQIVINEVKKDLMGSYEGNGQAMMWAVWGYLNAKHKISVANDDHCPANIKRIIKEAAYSGYSSGLGQVVANDKPRFPGKCEVKILACPESLFNTDCHVFATVPDYTAHLVTEAEFMSKNATTEKARTWWEKEIKHTVGGSL